MSEVFAPWSLGVIFIILFCYVTDFKVNVTGVFAVIALTIFPYGVGVILFSLARMLK